MFIGFAANAQDRIYLRNGDVLEAKVSEVGTRDIAYKKADNPDGPNYKIARGEVLRIEYENGSEDIINRGEVRMKNGKVEKVKYGRNIVAFAPVQLTNAGIGFGLSYERVLDKRGIISFYLPAAVGFNNQNTSVYSSSTGTYVNENEVFTGYMVMPGVKIYPTGSKGKVRYSVGPSIAALFNREQQGSRFVGYDNQGYPLYAPVNVDRFALGVIVNNTLNMQPTPRLYLGLELGLGMSYINQINGSKDGQTGFAQFAFKLGYRF
ncbi:hypothetical protein CAP35_09815 [Chitinophagaceae bacterium IBVUCB1]|nr:hypothetical protein CAP35_09815 [Chitinophagaceae bacterium IBVUCB1]